MVKRVVFLMLLVVLAMAGWADSTVNKSIHIAAQRQVAEGVDSVNGAITIGPGAVIQGDVETVNGGIDIGRDCRIEGQVETVNGGIDVARDGKIDQQHRPASPLLRSPLQHRHVEDRFAAGGRRNDDVGFGQVAPPVERRRTVVGQQLAGVLGMDGRGEAARLLMSGCDVSHQITSA